MTSDRRAVVESAHAIGRHERICSAGRILGCREELLRVAAARIPRCEGAWMGPDALLRRPNPLP